MFHPRLVNKRRVNRFFLFYFFNKNNLRPTRSKLLYIAAVNSTVFTHSWPKQIFSNVNFLTASISHFCVCFCFLMILRTQSLYRSVPNSFKKSLSTCDALCKRNRFDSVLVPDEEYIKKNMDTTQHNEHCDFHWYTTFDFTRQQCFL